MKKKKQSFADKHPLMALMSFPVTAPYYLGKAICEVKRSSVNKMTGLEYESYVARKLKEQGFHKIEVTKGSGDFGADILAVDKKGNPSCFQCKKYNGNVGIKAVQEVIAARQFYNCKRAFVVTNSYLTAAAKKLAQKARVELLEGFV